MEKHAHFILHKPYGYLSQFVNNQQKRRNKKLLSDLGNFPEGLMSVGRLDEKSEGLLLLTTDGQISNRIRQKDVEKEYFVMVAGKITSEAIDTLSKGVEIAQKRYKYQTLPCKVRALDNNPVFETLPRKVRSENHGPISWISITITEGKFRQVRKMTAQVGFPTLRLVRVRICSLTLGELKAGEFIKSDFTEDLFV